MVRFPFLSITLIHRINNTYSVYNKKSLDQPVERLIHQEEE